ncbi:hypothetical protein ACOBQX_29285 [Actinokineospora sp. G85]
MMPVIRCPASGGGASADTTDQVAGVITLGTASPRLTQVHR